MRRSSYLCMYSRVADVGIQYTMITFCPSGYTHGALLESITASARFA